MRWDTIKAYSQPTAVAVQAPLKRCDKRGRGG
jgi:hypothetical protein